MPFVLRIPSSGFAARNAKDHQAAAEKYLAASTAAEREKLFKEDGVRYYEFSRLSYFDPIRMTIVDPMHNLFLGMYLHYY